VKILSNFGDLKAQKHLYFIILKKIANKKSMLLNIDIFHNFGVINLKWFDTLSYVAKLF